MNMYACFMYFSDIAIAYIFWESECVMMDFYVKVIVFCEPFKDG